MLRTGEEPVVWEVELSSQMKILPVRDQLHVEAISSGSIWNLKGEYRNFECRLLT
jgi:hypothetical protein